MTSTVNITRIDQQRSSTMSDQLVVEEPLQIKVLYGSSGNEQTKNIAIVMRTPGHDEELVAGFLFTEGIVKSKSDLISIIPDASGVNTVLAIFKSDSTPVLPASERNFFISSSCGVCGESSIDALRKQSPFSLPGNNVSISDIDLCCLPERLRDGQQLFHLTGGIHACAFFDTNGKLLMLREDVGRHNALDKLIGRMMLNDQLPVTNNILLLSGRVSFEMVQKAAMAGIQMIAAIGAPSSLAVELALENGITLVGFLKKDRFNIYSYPERIEKSFS